MTKRPGGVGSGLVLLIGDILAVGMSYVLAYVLRSSILTLVLPEAFPFSHISDRFYLLVVYIAVFAYEGLYTKRLTGWEEARRCFRGMAVATAAIMMLPFVLRQLMLSRLVVLIAFLVGSAAVPMLRAGLRRLLVRLGLLRQGLVLLGAGEMAGLLSKEFERHRSLGYSVVEHADHAGKEALRDLVARSAVRTGNVSLAVVSDSFSAEELRQLFRHAEQMSLEVLVMPSAALLRSQAVEMQPIGSVLLMRYRDSLLRPLNRFLKRALELTACIPLLLLLAPFLLLLVLLVKFSSQGPVFFRQQRIGKTRRAFWCLKFRTMAVGAEERLQEILSSDPKARAEWETYARIAKDPRVTRVGRFLRRFSLDELPQLWNVLKGEMALVGPRPYLPSESGQVGEYLDTIVRVRPGMTGLWQVSGRSGLPFQERVILDEFYIRNWSLWMDFTILLRTIWVVLSGRGAC